ncbi:hypothetical protein C8R43DRAFT_957843 [Mycena crocata]|nr:hypothetical protein C8R43DRAFT_957843 [Mycena crocata]
MGRREIFDRVVDNIKSLSDVYRAVATSVFYSTINEVSARFPFMAGIHGGQQFPSPSQGKTSAECLASFKACGSGAQIGQSGSLVTQFIRPVCTSLSVRARSKGNSACALRAVWFPWSVNWLDGARGAEAASSRPNVRYAGETDNGIGGSELIDNLTMVPSPTARQALRNPECSNSTVYTAIKLKPKSSPPAVHSRTRWNLPWICSGGRAVYAHGQGNPLGFALDLGRRLVWIPRADQWQRIVLNPQRGKPVIWMRGTPDHGSFRASAECIGWIRNVEKRRCSQIRKCDLWAHAHAELADYDAVDNGVDGVLAEDKANQEQIVTSANAGSQSSCSNCGMIHTFQWQLDEGKSGVLYPRPPVLRTPSFPKPMRPVPSISQFTALRRVLPDPGPFSMQGQDPNLSQDPLYCALDKLNSYFKKPCRQLGYDANFLQQQQQQQQVFRSVYRRPMFTPGAFLWQHRSTPRARV